MDGGGKGGGAVTTKRTVSAFSGDMRKGMAALRSADQPFSSGKDIRRNSTKEIGRLSLGCRSSVTAISCSTRWATRPRGVGVLHRLGIPSAMDENAGEREQKEKEELEKKIQKAEHSE